MRNINESGDPIVLKFITDFRNHSHHTQGEADALHNLFMHGYCYYFAQILKAAFESGDIYVCAPYGHFVWGRMYNNKMVYYDIEGVSMIDAEHYIPESHMGDMVLDFKRVPGKGFNASQQDINDMIERYIEDHPNEIRTAR